MSENSNANGEHQTANNQSNMDDLDALRATNERLLKESRENKEKYKRALAEKEELEAKKLSESGDLAAQLEAERKRAQKYEAELKQTKSLVISQKMRDKLVKFAGDVYNPDDLITRPELKEFIKDGLDEDKLDFADDSAKKYIETLKKNAPYLWKPTNGVGANTSRPSSSSTQVSSVDIAKMEKEELKEWIKANYK